MTLIGTINLGTGTARTSGSEVSETVDCAHKGKEMTIEALMYMTYHGYATDGDEIADEASATATCGLCIPIGEDIAETNRYGGIHAASRAPEMAPKVGVRLVELGEPIKRVPPNGKTDSL